MDRSHSQGPGRFVVVVGPDGVGKTTFARALTEAYAGPTAYFHFRPPLRGGLPAHPPAHQLPPPGKGEPGGLRLLGWLRLARTVAHLWIAYFSSIRPLLRRGGLVVGDRWMYGYLAQPLAVRYHGPPWLARLAILCAPRPDLVVNLTASPGVIRARKQELSEEQIRHELAAWARVPGARVVEVEAVEAPQALAAALLAEMAA